MEQHEANQQSLGIDEDVNFEELLDNLEHLENDPRLWPKTLADLLTVIESQLKKSIRCKNCETTKVSRDVIAAIAHYLGGRQIYLPRDSRLQRALRDRDIYNDFDGTNHQALGDKHGLTAAQIYNILAQQKKLQKARLQPTLDF